MSERDLKDQLADEASLQRRNRREYAADLLSEARDYIAKLEEALELFSDVADELEDALDLIAEGYDDETVTIIFGGMQIAQVSIEDFRRASAVRGGGEEEGNGLSVDETAARPNALPPASEVAGLERYPVDRLISELRALEQRAEDNAKDRQTYSDMARTKIWGRAWGLRDAINLVIRFREPISADHGATARPFTRSAHSQHLERPILPLPHEETGHG